MITTSPTRAIPRAEHVRSLLRTRALERLSLSPQWGFASSREGNLLTEDEQWRKLELFGRVTDRVWPR